ncbi:hypothetical protein ACH4OY_05480 [Micromonospora rubida]|uniref:Exo-alpha-sialidase n=1 Tax=Micromonospora rubida TaxID=2697657 RepID=A0ABW7SJK7_9ACTN
MSDREFSGFDTERVAAAVRQPPLDTLRSTARARRRRRSAGRGAAAVIVLVGLLLGPLHPERGAVDWAGPDPTNPPVEPRGVSGLVLLSERSAVAVEERTCRLSFTSTSDTGRTWSDWHSIEFDDTCVSTPDPNGFGVSDIRYTVLGVRTYLVSIDGRSLLSTDAGRTWRDAGTTVTDVPSFPKDARPVSCQEFCGATRRPLALDPAGGRVYRLAGESGLPPLVKLDLAGDGALWTVYRSLVDGGADTIARSADRGATWRTSSAPPNVTVIAVAGVSGDEAYLLAQPRPEDPNGPPVVGRARLLHTTDGGRSWTDVDTDLPATPTFRPFTVGMDGTLLVGDRTGDGSGSYVWSSRDGGRHFTRSAEVGNEGTFGAARGLVWLGGRDDPADPRTISIRITADGRQWSRLPLPG